MRSYVTCHKNIALIILLKVVLQRTFLFQVKNDSCTALGICRSIRQEAELYNGALNEVRGAWHLLESEIPYYVPDWLGYILKNGHRSFSIYTTRRWVTSPAHKKSNASGEGENMEYGVERLSLRVAEYIGMETTTSRCQQRWPDAKSTPAISSTGRRQHVASAS